MRLPINALIYLISYLLVGYAFSSENKKFPFHIGEKLEYDLSWGIIPVGNATLQITKDKIQEEGNWKLNFFVRTNNFADAFYKVRTNVFSEIDPSFTKTLFYGKNQLEGKTQKLVDVKFDYQKKHCQYTENKKDPVYVALNGKVFDPLSIVYAFRLYPAKEGDGRLIPTCDGKKTLPVYIRIGKKEKIRVPFGTFTANSATPEMKNLSGVFKKSPKGMLKVWYSCDEKRLPLLIKSKVVVGSFTAKLRKVSKV